MRTYAQKVWLVKIERLWLTMLGIDLVLMRNDMVPCEFVDIGSREFEFMVDNQPMAVMWRHDEKLKYRVQLPHYMWINGQYALLNEYVKIRKSMDLPGHSVIAVQHPQEIHVCTDDQLRSLMSPQVTPQNWRYYSIGLERYCIAFPYTPIAQAWRAWCNPRIDSSRLTILAYGILLRIKELSQRNSRFVP